MSSKKKQPPRVLVIGLDSDGHKRITKGEGFVAVGGSSETHEMITEKAVKINEKLKKRGKTMETATHEEFDDAAHSVSLVRGDEVMKRQQEQQKNN